MLILENGHERQQVLDKLTKFFRDIGMPISAPLSQSEKIIKQQAVTKDKRQKILERFFSAIFAQVGAVSTGLVLAASYNKCSAVAEMGDRLATIDVARKVRDCCAPFRGGSCVPI